MTQNDENYVFPWGFHLGELHKGDQKVPLYTQSSDGGFCLLYDKESELKADKLLESLSLELLATMPHESLRVDLFDFGKKKFYNLSSLKYLDLHRVAYSPEMMLGLFEEIEDTIVARHTEYLCCNRPTISEHNQKSKIKMNYHLVLMNLQNFPTEDIELRRVQNFLESAIQAGVYIIAFGYHEMEQSESESIQAILKHLKKLRVNQGEFEITKEIFEFDELLEDHTFASLDLDKKTLMEQALKNADVENFINPTSIKLEENTKVRP